MIHAARSTLVTDGLYRVVRHPQYAGLILGILGTLIQWPTLITLVMAPILVVTYYRLARREERKAVAQFGEQYRRYQARTPMLIPRWPAVSGPVVTAETGTGQTYNHLDHSIENSGNEVR